MYGPEFENKVKNVAIADFQGGKWLVSMTWTWNTAYSSENSCKWWTKILRCCKISYAWHICLRTYDNSCWKWGNYWFGILMGKIRDFEFHFDKVKTKAAFDCIIVSLYWCLFTRKVFLMHMFMISLKWIVIITCIYIAPYICYLYHF
jgi:hypothetical protein